MSERPSITPNVLVGGDDPIARATGYLKRELGSEDGIGDYIVLALNGATGRMERLTNRRLRARTYRNPVTISCTSTQNSETVTGAGFLALKVGDDAVASNLEAGSRIDAIASDSSLTLTKKARTAGAPGDITFGSAPIVVGGDGTGVLRIPEYPVLEVYSVTTIDTLGVEAAVDLTGSRLEKATGKLWIMNAAIPKGTLNVEVECKAGYLPPSPTVIGDWEDWNDLEQICLRLTQVMFQDYAQEVGRTGDTNIVSFTQHIISFEMPADIADALGKYGRLW